MTKKHFIKMSKSFNQALLECEISERPLIYYLINSFSEIAHEVNNNFDINTFNKACNLGIK
jgi:hypothetical protein